MTPKLAIVNDISGYGRCSTSVILPIVSHLGVQGCALPTAIFSNHTGFPSFYCDDYTRRMPLYIDEWRKLGLTFDGITTGFLGSSRQIDIVEGFIRDFRTPHTVVIVDPVMGDSGRMYATYTPRLCREMKRLVKHADILTPNLTEACFLTDTPYHSDGWRTTELNDLMRRLLDLGAQRVVVTGIRMGARHIGNAVATRDDAMTLTRSSLVDRTRSGTGDVFAAVISADAVSGVPFAESVRRASRFVSQCLASTDDAPDSPANTGIEFERNLWRLRRR